MPNESLAHRPVEMLPLICPGDQREAAQLQVRERAAQLGSVHVVPFLNLQFTSYIYSPTLREKMAQAYDFALDKIGMEIMSYQVHRSEL